MRINYDRDPSLSSAPYRAAVASATSSGQWEARAAATRTLAIIAVELAEEDVSALDAILFRFNTRSGYARLLSIMAEHGLMSTETAFDINFCSEEAYSRLRLLLLQAKWPQLRIFQCSVAVPMFVSVKCGQEALRLYHQRRWKVDGFLCLGETSFLAHLTQSMPLVSIAPGGDHGSSASDSSQICSIVKMSPISSVRGST